MNISFSESENPKQIILMHLNQNQDSKSCFCFPILFQPIRNMIPKVVNHTPFMVKYIMYIELELSVVAKSGL